MSLIGDESNAIHDILQANNIYALLDTPSIPFKDIEDIECRVNNKHQTINIAATNRLKILKSFSIHKERMKTSLRMNGWINMYNDQFIDFRICYQKID